MKYNSLLIFLLIIVFFVSCIDDAPNDFNNPDSNWNPSFSFPVGYTSLGMDEDSGFDTLQLLIDTLTGFPFWVDEIDVPLSYTMPFNMQELNNFSEQIVSIMFRLNTQNGFPNQVKFQFYFQDINLLSVDSMFVDGPLMLDSGIPIGNGESVNSTSNQTNVLINRDKINELESVQYILMEGFINNVSLDTNLINYYPGYDIEIQIGIQVELNMTISSRSSNINYQ
ncbi:MAG: hypothetical protein PF485_07515 [Bacteroidales bacterium]|jgi:hypothetical protein|nr:hypothetical protein [Bacteroidales bacterium]